MPVFARTKIVMKDNCFEEDPGEIELKFVGPNAQKIYQRSYDLIKSVFMAADSDIQEESSSWGKAEKEKFGARWWLHKDMDLFTHLWIRFDISGEGTQKAGKARIRVRPVMRTEYAQDTIWQRSLLYEMLRTFWHRVFYHNKRHEYMVECRNLTTIYLRKMKEYFKILIEEQKSG